MCKRASKHMEQPTQSHLGDKVLGEVRIRRSRAGRRAGRPRERGVVLQQQLQACISAMHTVGGIVDHTVMRWPLVHMVTGMSVSTACARKQQAEGTRATAVTSCACAHHSSLQAAPRRPPEPWRSRSECGSTPAQQPRHCLRRPIPTRSCATTHHKCTKNGQNNDQRAVFRANKTHQQSPGSSAKPWNSSHSSTPCRWPVPPAVRRHRRETALRRRRLLPVPPRPPPGLAPAHDMHKHDCC